MFAVPFRLFLAMLLLVAGCGGFTDGDSTDRRLTYSALISGAIIKDPLQTSEFAPGSQSGAPTNVFSGRLVLDTAEQANAFQILVDEFHLAESRVPGLLLLPAFDFEFTQVGDMLLPLSEGLIVGEHPWWDWVLQPGRVWDETSDGDFSRAAIPFALKQRNEDCIHNGLLTFLFKSNGEVSRLAFQVTSQTCRYFQFEMHGMLQADYEPGSPAGAEQAAAQLAVYRDSRMPQKSIDELAVDYPGSNPSLFALSQHVDPQDMTAYGFIIDGVHYAGGCDTPLGVYPYCDEMALPSYSVAKSLVGGLGLMAMEQALPGTAAANVADYVTECGAEWDDVSIEHAIDMVTGHFASAEPHADEGAAINSRFFTAESHAEKIDYACNEYPRQAEPGEVWVYQTWASYLAGTALNNRWKTAHGSDADFFDDLLVDRIWEPLQLSAMAAQTRRSNDAVAQPFTGFGLTMLRDDIAKLLRYLGADDGRVNGESVLDEKLFSAIKHPRPDDPGKEAELPQIRYNNGFRVFNVAEYLGCEQATWVTTMSGFGGINYVLMPNDTAFYYVSDGNVHAYMDAVRESHRIRPMCSP